MSEFKNCIFYASFASGYQFRQLLTSFNKETTNLGFLLTPENIYISFVNEGEYGVHNAEIDTQELRKYSFNCGGAEAYTVGFVLKDMIEKIKNITKTDGVNIFQKKGETSITIQPIKNKIRDIGRINLLYVKIINYNFKFYKHPEDCIKAKPNLRIMSSDFCQICNQAVSLKCTSILFIGYENGAEIKGYLQDETEALYNKFGVIDDDDEEEENSDLEELSEKMKKCNVRKKAPKLNIIKSKDLMTFVIPIRTVKAMSKMENFSIPGAKLRFYFGEKKPMIITSTLATWGNYSLCIRDTKRK